MQITNHWIFEHVAVLMGLHDISIIYLTHVQIFTRKQHHGWRVGRSQSILKHQTKGRSSTMLVHNQAKAPLHQKIPWVPFPLLLSPWLYDKRFREPGRPSARRTVRRKPSCDQVAFYNSLLVYDWWLCGPVDVQPLQAFFPLSLAPCVFPPQLATARHLLLPPSSLEPRRAKRKWCHTSLQKGSSKFLGIHQSTNYLHLFTFYLQYLTWFMILCNKWKKAGYSNLPSVGSFSQVITTA